MSNQSPAISTIEVRLLPEKRANQRTSGMAHGEQFEQDAWVTFVLYLLSTTFFNLVGSLLWFIQVESFFTMADASLQVAREFLAWVQRVRMLTREVFHIREASVQSLRERTRSSIANPFVKISGKCQIIRKSPQEFFLIKSKIIQRLSQIESRPKFCIKIYFYHVLLKINFAATIWRETLPRANIWHVNHDVARTTTIRTTCRLFQPVLARTTSKKIQCVFQVHGNWISLTKRELLNY